MTPSASPRLPLLRRLIVALGLSIALTLSPVALAPAEAATKTPPVPSGLPTEVEDLSAYVPANSCSPITRPGTAKLGKLLTSTYPGTTYGSARACGALPNSEHHDGRAVDWMNNVRNEKQAAQAKALITWLFATDAEGNEYANARRLGVMYTIWNNKIWGAYSADRGWRPYSSCSEHPEKSWDNTCHRNHMHLSLSWAGAMGHTSFWTKEVAAPDYGRCRPADLNWSYPYEAPNPVPCPRYSVVNAPSGSSALMKTLVQHSGKHLTRGTKGAAVTAVQKAVKTKTTGTLDSATAKAIKKWQAAHSIRVTGTVNHTTWRALLKANAPK
ncbi:MAG TPA: peptidoglycan-binding domain-containing protein [Propionibacteriaceae bacterium]